MLQDTRTHVVVELYDTERSYVEALQILVNVSTRKLNFFKETLAIFFFYIFYVLQNIRTFISFHKILIWSSETVSIRV